MLYRLSWAVEARNPRSASSAALRYARGGQGATRLRTGRGTREPSPGPGAARCRDRGPPPQGSDRHNPHRCRRQRIVRHPRLDRGPGRGVDRHAQPGQRRNLPDDPAAVPVRRTGPCAGVFHRCVYVDHCRVLAPGHRLGPAVLPPRRGDTHGADPRRRSPRARVGTRCHPRRDGHRARDGRSL